MSTREIAKLTLYRGARSPYDAPDNFWACEGSPPPPATDWAHAAARGVMHDLGDRRGIKWHTENVAEDVRAELVQSLAEIIRAASDHQIEILRSRGDESVQRIADLSDYLRWVCEIARTWMPDYATYSDRSTLEQAEKALEAKP